MIVNIPRHALIVLIDGVNARLIRNVGSEASLMLEEERHFSRTDFANAGLPTSHAATRNGPTADEPVFAGRVAGVLTKMHELGRAAALVLIANSETTANLRAAMHEELKRSIILYLDQDQTDLPLPDVALALAQSMVPVR